MKPCPFCGPGTQVEAWDDDYGHWRVSCGACGSATGTVNDRLMAYWKKTYPDRYPADLTPRQFVIDFWNKRYGESS